MPRIHKFVLVLAILISSLSFAAGAPLCSGIHASGNSEYAQYKVFSETGAYRNLTDKKSYDVFKNFQKAFRDPGFYKTLEDDPQTVRDIFHQWYPTDKTDLAVVYQKLGSKLFPLILDPGIRFRLKDFVRFISLNPRDLPAEAYSVRELYSESLGTKTVYRGLRLKRNSIAPLSALGFPPKGHYSGARLTSDSHYEFTQFYYRGPNGDIAARLENQMYGVFSQSYTSIKTVAEGFAVNNLEKLDIQGRQGEMPILITAEVPILDLVGFNMLSSSTFMDRHAWKAVHFSMNDKWIWGGSEGLEHFVFGPLNPKWIVEIGEVTSGNGRGATKVFGITVN